MNLVSFARKRPISLLTIVLAAALAGFWHSIACRGAHRRVRKSARIELPAGGRRIRTFGPTFKEDSHTELHPSFFCARLHRLRSF